MSDHKVIFDTGAALVTLGTIAKILPAIAALVSIIWYSLRIYDWCVERFKK